MNSSTLTLIPQVVNTLTGNSAATETDGVLRLRFGTILSLDTTTTCTVSYGGATVSEVGWIGSSPSLGDCIMLQQGRLLFVVGNVTGGGGGGGAIGTVYNVKDYGATGDGTTNDTTFIVAALAACPAGNTLYFPEGIYVTDQIVITKCIHILGDGRWTSWLQPRTAISTSLVYINMPTPGASIRNYYGGSFRGIGIDNSSASSAIGLELNVNTGWYVGSDFYISGGSVSVKNAGTNNYFERFRLLDAGKFFQIDGETGLELTLVNGDCTRYAIGTTTVGIEVICTTGTTKGDLRIDNVVINCNASGSVVLTKGLVVQSTSLNLSVPVFATRFVVDNASGPSVKLVNVRDIRIEGWGNSAAGTTAACEISGGGNLDFTMTWFGGTRGVYEFLGSNATAGFKSSSYCPSSYVYRLTGSGKPTDIDITGDEIPGATVDSQVTDDIASLIAGRKRTWGSVWFQDTVDITGAALHVIGGSGEPAFQNSWVNETSTSAYFWRDATGVVHLSGRVKTGAAIGLCNLPVGYRPVYNKHYTGIHDDGTTVVIEITSSGDVNIYSTFPGASVSIDGSWIAGA